MDDMKKEEELRDKEFNEIVKKYFIDSQPIDWKKFEKEGMPAMLALSNSQDDIPNGELKELVAITLFAELTPEWRRKVLNFALLGWSKSNPDKTVADLYELFTSNNSTED